MINAIDMQGRTILVTGASSGIGSEAAVLISELNGRVALAGRNAERLQETRGRMRGEGHIVECFDLSDADAIAGWMKALVLRTGPLAGMVHSAGMHHMAPVRSLSPGRMDAMMRLNVTSGAMLVKAFRMSGCHLPDSSIVLLSSAAATTGDPGLSIYSATKAALGGFVRCAAKELATDRIRINCVAPGFVRGALLDRVRDTLMPEQFEAIERRHPLGLGNARDVAWAIAFLLADTARWITGSTLTVDGGYSA